MGIAACHGVNKCCESLQRNQDIDIDILQKTRRSAFEANRIYIGINEQHNKSAVNNNSYSEYGDNSPISVMDEETMNILLGMKCVDKLSVAISPITCIQETDLNDETSGIEEYNSFHDIVPEEMKQEIISNMISPEISDNLRKQQIIEYNRVHAASIDTINTEILQTDIINTEDAVESDEKIYEMPELPDLERMSGNKSNLMRMENTGLWEDDDMNELENEMKNQLELLKINSLSMDRNTFDNDDDDDDGILVINADYYTHDDLNNIDCNDVEDDDESEYDVVTPNLLRPKSINKWDINDIDFQTNEIKQQIVRLSSQTFK